MIDIRMYNRYNVIKYIESIVEVRSLLLDGIVSNYHRCNDYEISPDVTDYLYYVNEEPFYVSPTFSDVRTNSAAPTLHPKFILFSAPGATGKSALARYLSYKFNALYWNLAKVKLGTNSFAGSILNAVGSRAYSNFVIDLNNANMLLIIDAFDEAEIISGRKMVSSFISDINSTIQDNAMPSVFFLARTETAQYIASFCAENKIPILHYEIGFFAEGQAKEFIEKSIVGKSRIATVADKECIDSYYKVVGSNISEVEKLSFLGYAPVLEAISAHIKSSKNRAKMISMLTTQTSCVSIIMKIMDDLLKREQDEKVIPAFKERCVEQYPEFNDWERLYSPQEQLVRIISYILFNDTDYSNYPLDFMPSQIIDEYQDILNTFLPQHPFIRNNFDKIKQDVTRIDFTGPAFRDYTLAQLILNDAYADHAEMYFGEAKSDFYFPSQIFFDCYRDISEDNVRSSHLYYVFESYRAKAAATEHPYLQCSEVLDEEGNLALLALFGMSSIAKKDSKNREEVVLQVNSPGDTLSFEQLSNVSLDAPHFKVIIGDNGKDTHIYNSSIICDQIIWRAENVAIESYPPEGCLLVCQKATEGGTPRFDILSDKNLRVSLPNLADFYRLVSYKYDFDDLSNADITKFTHAMRCIMMEFRTHKKDTLAKDRERIDNVTVGNNPLKRQVLEYLKHAGIIYKSAHLYKVDTEKMQKVGISYAALARMRTDLLEIVYSDFCRWSDRS